METANAGVRVKRCWVRRVAVRLAALLSFCAIPALAQTTVRRLFCFAFLLLFVSEIAQAQSAFVVANSGTANSGTTATTAAFNAPAGSMIHAVAMCRGAQASPTFSDDGAHTWTVNETTTANTGDGDVTVSTARAFNTAGSATRTVTITWSASCGSAVTIAGASYSGLTTVDPFDVDAGDTWSSTTTPTSNTTATTTQANELIVGSLAMTVTATITAGSGFTKRVEICNSQSGGVTCVSIEDKNVSATGTQTADFSLSAARTSAVHVAAYKDAAGGGGGTFNYQLSGASRLSGAARVNK